IRGSAIVTSARRRAIRMPAQSMAPADPPAPTGPDVLDALARKYHALVALRDRRDRGGAPATRAELRGLAAGFPGRPRERDTLGPEELARRAAAVAAAVAGGAREPWMDWIATYHALMADLLATRARGGAVAAPEGRLNVKVLRELSARFGVAAA